MSFSFKNLFIFFFIFFFFFFFKQKTAYEMVRSDWSSDVCSSDLKLVSIAYPLMDLMILTAAIRLAVGTGTRPTAFYLMALSIVALFVTDSVYSWISVHGIVYDNTTGYLEGGWALFYVLWGAAALHRSMRQLETPTPEREVKNPRLRLYLLAGASLMAPAVELFQALRGEQVDVPVLAGCSAVLFILVIARLQGLM